MTAASDAVILAAIGSGGSSCDRALQGLYKAHLPMVTHFITQNGGSKMDAEDRFQDALTVLYEHVRDGVFQGRSSLKSYLMAIVRNMWFTELKRRGLWRQFAGQEIEAEHDLPDTPADILLSSESRSILDHMLAQLGDSCRQTLVWRFWESRPMREIAAFLGFKNEQVAKNKQQTCLNRLRELLAANPAAREVLRGML